MPGSSDAPDYAGRRIPLTQGCAALVDAADYERLCRFKWHVARAGSKLYARRWDGSKKRNVGMHEYIVHRPDGLIVDHINADGLDNRRSNLRLTCYTGNAANSPGKRLNASGYRGVRDNGDGTYDAILKHADKAHYMGRFDNPIEAAIAYDEEAVAIWGEMATTNARLGLI